MEKRNRKISIQNEVVNVTNENCLPPTDCSLMRRMSVNTLVPGPKHNSHRTRAHNVLIFQGAHACHEKMAASADVPSMEFQKPDGSTIVSNTATRGYMVTTHEQQE